MSRSDDAPDVSSEPEAGPIDDAALAARRRDLESRLAARRGTAPNGREEGRPASGMAGMAQGLKIASEFVAGVIVGAAIGYLVDLGLGTQPFGLIVFLLIGFAAGVVNVLRVIGKGPAPPGPPPPRR